MRTYILSLVISLFLSSGAVWASPFSLAHSESSRMHFLLQGSSSNLKLGSKSFQEFGIRPIVGFFPWSQLSLYGSYFAVIKPDGSSNLNGFGFGGRYHFPTSGTGITLRSLGTTLESYPSIVYFIGAEFSVRDLKSSSITFNFTGFTYSVGLDWHFHRKWFANGELSMASLKNALGSAAVQKLEIVTLGLAIGIML